MKLNDVVTESLTQEGMWDNLKSKFTKQPAAAPDRQEPTLKGNVPQQYFPGDATAGRNDPTGSGTATVAQGGKTDPIMGYEAPVSAPTTTYNVPTGGLPAVSSTMPQNMPATPPGKAGATKPTYNAPTGMPATNAMMPSNMGTNAAPAAPAAAQAAPAPAEKPAATKPTYNAPTGMPATNAMMPSNMASTPTATVQQKPAPAAPSAKPAAPAAEPVQAAQGAAQPTPAQGAAPAAGKAKSDKTAGGGIWQGIKDLFDPNAAVARATNKNANAVRAEAIKGIVQQWQLVSRGMDPNDVEYYQDAFGNWAKQRFPDVDDVTIDEIASDINPMRPATITKAVGSAYNTQMAARPTMSKQALKHKQGQEKISAMQQQADDEELTKQFKNTAGLRNLSRAAQAVAPDLANQLLGHGQTAHAAPSAAAQAAPSAAQEPMSIGGQRLDPKNPEDAKLIQKIQQSQQTPAAAPTATATAPAQAATSQDLTPQTGSKEEADVIDNLKTLKGTEQKLMQKLNTIRSSAKPAATQEPEENPNVVQGMNESRVNFAGILWKQLKGL